MVCATTCTGAFAFSRTGGLLWHVGCPGFTDALSKDVLTWHGDVILRDVVGKVCKLLTSGCLLSRVCGLLSRTGGRKAVAVRALAVEATVFEDNGAAMTELDANVDEDEAAHEDVAAVAVTAVPGLVASAAGGLARCGIDVVVVTEPATRSAISGPVTKAGP